MQKLAAFGAGLLFGLGLLLSGMTDPSKVQGFLDLFGRWDPSLALVMGGAIAIGYFAFARGAGMEQSALGAPMHRAGGRRIDARLMLGSLTFGVGWGLAGYCPGPAIVWLGTGDAKTAVFVLAMAGGMALYELSEARSKPRTA